MAGSLEHGVDSRLLRLSPADNVLIVGRRIARGERYRVNDVEVAAEVDLAVGSKVAASDLEPGDVVLRLGVPIGEVTEATHEGAWVHSHNLVSRRQPATTRIEISGA